MTNDKRDHPRREPSFSDQPFTTDDEPIVPGEHADMRPAPQSSRKGAAGGQRKAPARAAAKRGAPKRRRGRSRHSFLGMVFSTFMTLAVWGAIAVGGVLIYHFMQLPPIDTLAVPRRPPNIAVMGSDGTLLANKGDTGGKTVTIKELPPYLPKAFVAIEDRRFYDHFGLDPLGIVRALARNVSAGGVSQGGSTLTQQLAKNLFLTQERTMSRKIQEAILALWLEQTFTKDEILALYLNRVYFGAGAYGVEAAALRYFNKHASEVSVAEAAMLAGLVQAPSRLAPTRNPQAAQARAQLVLTNMVELGFITDKAAKDAMMSPAQTVRPGGAGSVNYAADYVMDILDDYVGAVETDIVVRTTIDGAMVNAGESALTSVLNEKGAKAKVSQGTLVALAPDGAIRVLIGGRNYGQSQFNRATSARRQPGSSFKPFVYLAALENGLNPDTVREDAPINLNGWQPRNFSRRYSGPVTLATALARSLNTVVVRLAMEVGPRTVVQTAQRMGISSPLQANASIALGTSEVTPLEITAAYAAFANGGTGVVPYIIRDVKTTAGKVLYKHEPTDLGRVASESDISMMNYMLHMAATSGSAKGGRIAGWEVAAKTGTSQEERDAWFMGYTGSLVTSVWLGNDDNSPTNRVTGGTLPAEVWRTFMTAALKNQQPVPLFGSPWDAPAALPPEGIPQAGIPPAQQPTAQVARPAPEPQREKSLLDLLFGG